MIKIGVAISRFPNKLNSLIFLCRSFFLAYKPTITETDRCSGKSSFEKLI